MAGGTARPGFVALVFGVATSTFHNVFLTTHPSLAAGLTPAACEGEAKQWHQHPQRRRSPRFMTASSSAVWKRAKPFAGASSSPIAPRKSPRKAKLSPSARANRSEEHTSELQSL